MQLSEPRVDTRTTHIVSVRVTDGPVLTAPPTGGRQPKFRVDYLSIRWVDGALYNAEVRGVLLRADGQPHERGTAASINYVGRDTDQLLPETPDWVREVVEAHPWPGGADRDALLDLLGSVERVQKHSPRQPFGNTVIPAAADRARRHVDRTGGAR